MGADSDGQLTEAADAEEEASAKLPLDAPPPPKGARRGRGRSMPAPRMQLVGAEDAAPEELEVGRVCTGERACTPCRAPHAMRIHEHLSCVTA